MRGGNTRGEVLRARANFLQQGVIESCKPMIITTYYIKENQGLSTIEEPLNSCSLTARK